MSKIILNGIEYSNGITYQELQPVIYSTEEREIGCWTDGKPLYQKTWDFGSAITVNSNTWTDTSISNSNIEAIVKVVGGNLFSGKISCFDGLSATADTGSVVKILQSRNLAISVRYLTLQYTKTTDTAGSGSWTPSGVPSVHYSTNEQVIGTWIDSKPLYQKTVNFGALPNSTSKSVAHGISDLDKIVDFSALAKRPEPFNIIPLPSSHYQSTSAQQEISFNATNITIRNGNNASAYTDVYITLRYTKTTD